MTFNDLFSLEAELAAYTGAPYVVVTDGCTHAIELAMRWYQVKQVEFTAYTYLSIPQTMINLGIKYQLLDETWSGEYQFHGTNIWDSARRLEPNMYRSGQVQCLSFGHTKPLAVGRCGAILLDDPEAHHHLSCMRADGRDLSILPWETQQAFGPGWHYCPSLEKVNQVREKLKQVIPQCQTMTYPDCRKISFIVDFV
jgi:dTDP-4-amino-4,6-dideoxygalactose transaminase